MHTFLLQNPHNIFLPLPPCTSLLLLFYLQPDLTSWTPILLPLLPKAVCSLICSREPILQPLHEDIRHTAVPFVFTGSVPLCLALSSHISPFLPQVQLFRGDPDSGCHALCQ